MTGLQARRLALVTGATSGIGLATAIDLARHGCHVLVHGRSESSASRAVQEVSAAAGVDSVEAVWADLSVMAEVRALAQRLLDRPRLDILVHNAGVERWQRTTTVDGFEQTFAVNHLAPFLLTRLLAPVLARSRPARVVFVSSMVHGWGVMHWDDLQAAGWYSPEPVYNQSKLAAALAAQELARRLAPQGVFVLLVPPGLVQTAFGRDFRGFARLWSRAMGSLFFRRPADAAREVAAVALEDSFAVHGAYVDRLEIGVPAPRARVRADQERIWQVSSQLLGLPAGDPPPGDPLPAVATRPPRASQWLRAVIVGEAIGFTATAMIAFLGLVLCGHPATIRARLAALAVMVLAGTIEGASLGFFQWRALSRWLPDLSARRFVGATIAVASGGWLAGMSVPLLGAMVGAHPAQRQASPPSKSTIASMLFAAGFGLVAGALFGAAQSLALKNHVDKLHAWVLGNAVGWAIGLPAAYFAGRLGSASMSGWAASALSAAAGACMGGAVGAGTLLSLRRMRATPPAPPGFATGPATVGESIAGAARP